MNDAESQKVLIVDDEEEILRSLGRFFSVSGFEPVVANSYSEAVDVFNGQKIDIGIIDVRLPDGNGLDLFLQLKKINPEFSCIIMTGHASLDTAVRSVNETGIVSYEMKPFDAFRIVSVIKEVFSRKRAEKALLQREEMYRALVEDMPAMVCRFKPGGIISFANNAFSEYANLPVEKLIGRSIFNLYSSAEPDFPREKLRGMNREHPVLTFENPGEVDTANFHWVKWIVRILEFRDDRPAEYQVIGIDISEEKQLQNKLTRRIRTLDCQYEITKISESVNDLDEILLRVVDIIPASIGSSSSAGARIVIGEKEYTSTQYSERLPMISSDIMIRGSKAGILEYCKGSDPLEAGMQFTMEEFNDISAIAGRLGFILDSKRNEDKLLVNSRQLSELSRKVISAQEEERARVARELHDSLGQKLVATQLEIGWMKDKVFPDAHGDAFQSLIGLTEEAASELHTICQALRPVALDKMGFVPALNRLIRDYRLTLGNTDVYSELEMFSDEILPPGASINIYRIVQEALNNAAKHSGATKISVVMHRENGKIEIKIKDNGTGIPDYIMEDGYLEGGFGLMGMHERARIFGAEISVSSSSSMGTCIGIRLPEAVI